MVELAHFLSKSGWRHYLENTVMMGFSYVEEGETVILRNFQDLYWKGLEHKNARYGLRVISGASTPKQRWYAFLEQVILQLRMANVPTRKTKSFQFLD